MARWSRDALGLGLVGMLLPLCSEVGLLSVDDTLCRKFGRKWVSSQLRLITWLHAEPTGWDALPEELRGVRRLVQC